MERDIVCGTDVDPRQARAHGLSSDHEGRRYYFCSPECRREFENRKDRYARKEVEAPKPAR